MGNTDTPRVLILGATGRTGAAVVKTLEATPDGTVPVLASRSKATVEQWIKEGKEAVHIDLDDPDTFPGALEGIDRVFLMTGYTSAMNHQAKALVDAAEDAGVGFLVHLGVFSDGRSTDPHFAWHELVERYIAGSKLAWANVHPHVFMENLLGINRLRDGQMVWPMGDKRVGWIAGDDIAAVVGKILIEGPETHAGKDYFLSTDLLDGAEVAEALSTALGRDPGGHPDPGRSAAPDRCRAEHRAGQHGLRLRGQHTDLGATDLRGPHGLLRGHHQHGPGPARPRTHPSRLVGHRTPSGTARPAP